MSDAPVILITGAGRGIGAGLAERYATDGYRVVGCSRGAIDHSVTFDHRVTDVSNEAAVADLFSYVAERYGRLDAVVNSAGVGPAGLVALAESSDAQLAERTNFLGTFHVCREAARLMMRARSGRIVNMSSVAVPLRMEGAAIYSATKAAIVQFTKVFAREIAPAGLTCNVVAPSLVDTDMFRALAPKARERYIGALTIRRLTTLDEVFDAVRFFTRPESGYVTGQVLHLGLAD